MRTEADCPIVAAVRKAREQLVQECGGDLGKLLDVLKQEERRSGRPTGSPRQATPDSE